MSLSGNQNERRDEPRGIARYFQPQGKSAQTPAQPLTIPMHPHAPPLQGTPSSGPPRPVSDANVPSTATLTRTPSRISVVIGTSSHRKRSQSASRDGLEDSLEVLKVTSDLNPSSRRTRPTTPLPTTAAPPTKPSSATPRPRGRPASTTRTPRLKPAPATVPHASTTAAPAPTQPQTPATQPPPKRRGRPVGWRAGMGAYSARASFPGGPSVPRTKERGAGAAAAAGPKRRGRPAGRAGGVKPTRAIFEKLRPRYVPFLCEWEGCPAELQNVDTLRRHVLAVHGRDAVARGSCRWGKCAAAAAAGRAEDQAGGGRRGRRTVFASADEFGSHVEDWHLVPFVWHVGDGPRNTVVEYKVKTPDEAAVDLPDYLFDEEGNQVTPSVLNQEFENDEERKERRRRLHRLLLERDRNAPEEVLMEEDEHEKVLGP